MIVSYTIRYIGVNDHEIDLFEGQYRVPRGMAYNSYAILDEKVAVLDTVDARFRHEWLDNIQKTLGARKPDYLVVQHMEPDHSANVAAFLEAFPAAKVVASAKAFAMMKNFFGTDFADRQVVVGEGSTLPLGRRTLHFVTAPMVHWPEVLMTYDDADKVLFSADGFGKFGANDVEDPEGWACEARRYYFGIVGKYGAQVQAVLKKAAGLEIRTICPLHGPVLSENLGTYLGLYDTWSKYEPETEGVFIAYTSVYGHTKAAVELLAEKLRAKGCPRVAVADLARDDMPEAVEDAFRHSKLVLATTTYNADIFPFMRTFVEHLTERAFQNRDVAFVENGSWAPLAAKTMHAMLEKQRNIRFARTTVHIKSALSDESRAEIEALADELCQGWIARREAAAAPAVDPAALFKIGYGLYVVATRDEAGRDNGCIVNTVTQVTNAPNRVAVTINKLNYTHHVVKQTGIMNLNCLSEDAPFDLFKRFGFQSGRTADKFAGEEVQRAANGLAILPSHVNALLSLKVEQYVDLGTHGMFICSVEESRVLSQRPTMTYAYYQDNVKPKPDTGKKKGWVCKICGYVHEGDELPEDFICPLCKHGAADFERLA